MTGAVLAALLSATIAPVAELPPSGIEPCAIFDKPSAETVATRSIAAADLVGLADIGRSDPFESESPFGISPDGRSIAFVVRRANANADAYCQRLLVAPLGGGQEAREVDRGGDIILRDFDLRKFVSITSGMAKVVTPRWSPDGRHIAYLKKAGSTHQVWLVESSGGSPAVQASRLPDNVDDFAWNADGTALVIASRPGIRLQAEAIARESLAGFLFDDRFAPQIADRPIPIDPVATDYSAVELAGGVIRKATPQEIALLRPERPPGVPRDARTSVQASGGAIAWREPRFPQRLLSPSRLAVRLPDGRELGCDMPCGDVRHLWWSADGEHLYILAKTGWADKDSVLLRWRLSEARPVQIMTTADELIGCASAGGELVCAREGSVRPRRLVAIDPESGRERLVFDPNPDFALIALGTVRRLRFRTAFGVESHADLVLPPGHRPGEKHPLVVVQYHSQGFLRGGTGDEFPIQLLAAKGFAVLSFARPASPPAVMAATSELELMKAGRRDWIDRRNVHSALETAVAQAIATGTVDAEHMGISGFSDGTATVQWALVNSALFKAAAVGTCCEDMSAFALAAGPVFTQQGRDIGAAFFEPGAEAHWKPQSLLLNVDRIDVPILIQNNDSEYEGSLDVVELYKLRGKAIEMFVMEGAPHIKYRPAHRLAIYERSTEWFQFWLQGVMNCDPARVAQYARWRAMKGAPDAPRCEVALSGGP